MDTTTFSEGQYITPEFVKNSPSKIGVILGEASPQDTKYGKQLSVNVEIDRRIKTWNLNRDSVKNMQQLGMDSMSWVSKRVMFHTVIIAGKDRVIGNPIID
jgi:hypothetical protein